MPCDDVSEVLELELDAHERVLRFALRKGTCGAPVGATLERRVLGARTESLLALPLEALLPSDRPVSSHERFLLAKELAALQAVLRAYGGLDEATATSPFALASIDFDPQAGHTTIRGTLKVDVVAAQVPACGQCGRSTGPHEAS